MAFTSNIMIVRHRLLKELVKLWNNNELVDKIDRLPIELSPKRSKHAGRCCVHKERAVWKYQNRSRQPTPPLLSPKSNSKK